MGKVFDIALSFATEDQVLVENVYHYMKAEGFSVFFAPSPEGQALLSGKNQREIFYQIFGLMSKHVALFVSKDYVSKQVPMEEARIALAKHSDIGGVIPIYLDSASLPPDMLDPQKVNYYRSSSAANIAAHLSAKLRDDAPHPSCNTAPSGEMHISGNVAKKQFFIQNVDGGINFGR